jgi:putative transposase
MSKKAEDSLTRVEKHFIRPSSPWFSMIGDFCHKAKNLYNSEEDVPHLYRWG